MKKWIIISVGSLLVIMLIALGWQWMYIKSTTEEVFLLPQGFKGIVLIAYNQPDGLEDVIKDERLIYKIPTNGVLKLQRKSPPALSRSWYYFEDEKGGKDEFYYCYPPCNEMKENPDKVFAYGMTNGKSFDDNYEIDRTIFLVGTAKDTNSLNLLAEKFNPIETLKSNK